MSRPPIDRVLVAGLRVCGASAGIIVALVVIYLALGAWPALREIGLLRFLTDSGWYPTGGAAEGRFELGAMLVGSLATTLGAMLLTAPLGVLSAVFCHYYAPEWLRSPYRRLVELLAGIPSVVYGFWGLATLAPLLRIIEPPGTSLIAGVLVLTLMIVPTVALLADAALQAVPKGYLEGAAALSLSRFTQFRGVIFPAARSSLAIAVVLGTMRAIGETMAVLMVCGNLAKLPDSIFAPVRTLTANIALELGYATEAHRSVLFVSGLALMVMVLMLVALQERLKQREALG